MIFLISDYFEYYRLAATSLYQEDWNHCRETAGNEFRIFGHLQSTIFGIEEFVKPLAM